MNNPNDRLTCTRAEHAVLLGESALETPAKMLYKILTFNEVAPKYLHLHWECRHNAHGHLIQVEVRYDKLQPVIRHYLHTQAPLNVISLADYRHFKIS